MDLFGTVKSEWAEIDEKVLAFETTLKIPDERLSGVTEVLLSNENDLKAIPAQGGCYWIWTTEPVKHSLHPNENKFPKSFNKGEIIYNGISKDDIRGRIKKHLFGKIGEGMSAISVDLLFEEYKGSHRKKAFCSSGKAPYFNGARIQKKEQFLEIHLSARERDFVERSDFQIYFRNGINILDEKHKDYLFKVYFLSGFKSASYGDIIEKEWRRRYGLPKLCSYHKGR